MLALHLLHIALVISLSLHQLNFNAMEFLLLAEFEPIHLSDDIVVVLPRAVELDCQVLVLQVERGVHLGLGLDDQLQFLDVL